MSWNPTELYKSHSVATEYDASRFSSLAGRLFNAWEQHVICACFRGLQAGARLADVPCGTGRLAEPLLARGFRVHGIDISGEMLEVAKRRLERFGGAFTCEVGDATRLSGGAPVHDGALCARVLMHFPIDQQVVFLTGVSRLSRGVVVINHSLDSPYQRFRRRLKRLFSHATPARFPLTNDAIAALLQRSGLREVRRRRLLPLVSEAVYLVAEPAGIGPNAI